MQTRGRSLLLRADTPQAARATSGDETDLLTGRRQAVRRRRVTDVLVVTTTEGVLHRVHRHTTHVRPLVALDAEPVIVQISRKEGRHSVDEHGRNEAPSRIGPLPLFLVE